MESRAGRYLGILVIPQYGNQTVRVSSNFQFIAFSIIEVLLHLGTHLRQED